MKVLVFGENGQVAGELKSTLTLWSEVQFVGHEVAPFESPDRIVDIIRAYEPHFIVNAAAYTNVEKAESERDQAYLINGHTVGVIAEEAKKLGAGFIHYSTDYVFDGSKNSAYTEVDQPKPLNVYGESKLLGEKLIQQVDGNSIILRVSWVYGNRGVNFYKTMLKLASEREELKIVSDQIGAPTWCRNIAEATSIVLQDKDFMAKKGLYHMTSQGEVSWYGFAKKIFELYSHQNPTHPLKVKNLVQIETKDYPSKSQRPLNSRMSSQKIKEVFGLQLPHWEESLKNVMNS